MPAVYFEVEFVQYVCLLVFGIGEGDVEEFEYTLKMIGSDCIVLGPNQGLPINDLKHAIGCSNAFYNFLNGGSKLI